jgi:hypothetical protein
MTRLQWTFLALITTQAAHSLEEYAGRLWEGFPPARLLSGLVSPNLETGFVVINVSVVAFGFWCFLWPIRRRWRSAVPLAWFWVVLGLVNGVGHSTWSVLERAYTPGLVTALPLLVLAAYLGRQLATQSRAAAA